MESCGRGPGSQNRAQEIVHGIRVIYKKVCVTRQEFRSMNASGEAESLQSLLVYSQSNDVCQPWVLTQDWNAWSEKAAERRHVTIY